MTYTTERQHNNKNEGRERGEWNAVIHSAFVLRHLEEFKTQTSFYRRIQHPNLIIAITAPQHDRAGTTEERRGRLESPREQREDN